MKTKSVKITQILSEIWENQSDYQLTYENEVIFSGADFALDIVNYYSEWYYTYTDAPITVHGIVHTATEYEWFYMLWRNYLDNNADNFRKLYQALHYDYNGALNDDYTETYNENKADTFEHGKVSTTTFNDFKTKTTYNSNVTDQVTTDTNDSYRNDTKQNRGGDDTVEQLGSTALTNSGTDTHRIIRDELQNRKTVQGRHGNTADTILSEINLRTDADLSDYILSGFIKRHLYILNEMGCCHGT